jgi:hypothetical protein
MTDTHGGPTFETLFEHCWAHDIRCSLVHQQLVVGHVAKVDALC